MTQTVPDISPLMPMHQDPLLVTLYITIASRGNCAWLHQSNYVPMKSTGKPYHYQTTNHKKSARCAQLSRGTVKCNHQVCYTYIINLMSKHALAITPTAFHRMWLLIRVIILMTSHLYLKWRHHLLCLNYLSKIMMTVVFNCIKNAVLMALYMQVR